MTSDLAFDFIVDKENKSVNVRREFDAELPLVWDAYTKKELLDQWWAPKPWKARTKKIDFRPGGEWMYCMVGPEGEEHWCIARYNEVKDLKLITWSDAFTDKDGKINTEMPQSNWEIKFTSQGKRTLVDVKITHDTLEDLEAIIKMGFKEGFTMALGNLDELLAK